MIKKKKNAIQHVKSGESAKKTVKVNFGRKYFKTGMKEQRSENVKIACAK